MQLRGAGGSDGLHVVQRNTNGSWLHYQSGDGGATWSQIGLPQFATSVDIGAQRDGEVYISLNNAGFSGNYELFYWDPVGTSLVDQGVTVAGNLTHYPFMSNGPLGEMLWCHYDNVGGNLVTEYGDQSNPFTNSVQAVSGQPLWRGAVSSGGDDPIFFTLSSGANPWDGLIGFYFGYDNNLNGLYEPLIQNAPPNDWLTEPTVDGRTLDSSDFIALPEGELFITPAMLNKVFTCAQGSLFDGFRYQRQVTIVIDSKQANIPFNITLDETTIGSSDIRRTVSSTTAGGVTSVNLYATVTTDDCYFEWSNYGDWESLELPAGLANFSRPELVVGTDGSWHLVYVDLSTGNVMCWNSI
jgi:hypothetical protein